MVGFGYCLEVVWRVSGGYLEGVGNFLAPKIILDPKLFFRT